MIVNGFYKIKQEYYDLIVNLGGVYNDNKSRPIFCCIEDNKIPGLFWAIPTSDYLHRTPEQKAKYQEYSCMGEKNIRSAWYFVGHTNIQAVYRISSCLPITEKYVKCPYISKGSQLILRDKKDILTIRKKLGMILITEKKYPNKFEQHITDIKNYLIEELNKTCGIY
jgi:hypothetical protein